MQPSTPIDWNAYIGQILAVAIPVLLTFFVTVITYLTWFLKKKMDASTALDKNKLGEAIADRAVLKAEEDSAQRVRAGGPALTGDQKMVVAMTFALDKQPEKTSQAVVDEVQAAVGANVSLGSSKGVGEMKTIAKETP